MKLLVVALLSLMPALCAASSSELLKNCKSAIEFMETKRASNEVGAAFCMGYIFGITEGYKTTTIARPTINPVYCAPTNTDLEQDIRVVVRYLESNPQELHIGRSALVLFALRDAYPCR